MDDRLKSGDLDFLAEMRQWQANDRRRERIMLIFTVVVVVLAIAVCVVSVIKTSGSHVISVPG